MNGHSQPLVWVAFAFAFGFLGGRWLSRRE